MTITRILAAAAIIITQAHGYDYELVVYGATGGGVISAVGAGRMGRKVLLLADGSHIGGMVTGGLQHTDVGNASVIGGLTLEFFKRVMAHYSPPPSAQTTPPGWMFESHVAEAVMVAMLDEANVTVVRAAVGIAGVTVVDQRVRAVTMLAGPTYTAAVFIDASYCGDLLAAANASMTVGRESQVQYNETFGGRRPIQLSNNQLPGRISPFLDRANSSSPVLPLIYTGWPGNVGDGDKKVTTYDFRLCMTMVPTNRVPITEPRSYQPELYELFRRLYAAHPPRSMAEAGLACLGPIPTSVPNETKCDMIGSGGLSTDMIGASWAYPDANLDTRQIIHDQHVDYTLGLLWFWGTDAAVPANVRAEFQAYGLCKDEYLDTSPPHWPHQLYIREARRLVGDFVFTQNMPPAEQVAQSIGMGSYVFDCHQVQRVIHFDQGHEAWVVNEGEMMSGLVQKPYSIPYATLLPKVSELTNILAAVPVSASHVRFSSLRMEPTWMIMGHAAALAAHLALVQNKISPTPHTVNTTELQALLRSQQQILYS